MSVTHSLVLSLILGACQESKDSEPDTSTPADTSSTDSGSDTASSHDSAGTDTGSKDSGEPTVEVYDLSEESYATEVVWTGNQGSAAENNFNSKNYHSMSVWRAGYTYAIYVDDSYTAQVVKISDDGSEVSSSALADYEVLADGHHSFSIGSDAAGYLHVSGDMHNYPDNNADHLPSIYQGGKCMYWRSSEPLSIDDFTWLGDGPDGQMPYGDSFSYMTFTNDRDGNLFYYARTHPNRSPARILQQAGVYRQSLRLRDSGVALGWR